LFGADPIEKGEIQLAGRLLAPSHPRDAILAGIVLVPEERRKQGILVHEPVRLNLALPTAKGVWIDRAKEKALAHSLVAKLGIKTPGIEAPVSALSGGNQQKVAIGKWLPADAQIYLFDEPTKGVDIGAKRDIFRLIGELAKQGKGILYFSCEHSELLGIADRIYVMCDGQIVHEMARHEATSEAILYYASAGKGESSWTVKQ
jgi:simple sugar transport system ATP-binding protein